MSGSTAAPTTPAIDTDFDAAFLTSRFPPYQVILHNDDIHSMDEVVLALCRSIPAMTLFRAITLMYEAHSTGRAIVIVCGKEEAELYAERLGTYGLTVTLEPVV